MQEMMTSSSLGVFPLLAVFRLCSALLVQTYFNPDEYWQGPEIAHRLVFARGYQYVETAEIMPCIY